MLRYETHLMVLPVGYFTDSIIRHLVENTPGILLALHIRKLRGPRVCSVVRSLGLSFADSIASIWQGRMCINCTRNGALGIEFRGFKLSLGQVPRPFVAFGIAQSFAAFGEPMPSSLS